MKFRSITIAAIAVLTLFLFNSLTYSQPAKRVLLEQFTGAWCGWCPDGTVFLDSILAKYPDKVIGVKLHYGDAMETAETYLVNSAYAMTAGWPSGAVDRIRVYDPYSKDSVRCLSRNLWEDAVVKELNSEPTVDVHFVYDIDTLSRKIWATVSAKFLV